jgi:hypothetical protein
MYHCIKECFDKQSRQWLVGEISPAVPSTMEAYFKEGLPEKVKEPEQMVYLSQYARPAFDPNPSEVMPLSEYGKPKKKVNAK